MDIMERAAPPKTADAPADESGEASGEKLPPNWKRVPSSTRKGEFSYLHMPTGFKQAFFPTSDEPSGELLEQARQAQALRSAAVAPPPSEPVKWPSNMA